MPTTTETAYRTFNPKPHRVSDSAFWSKYVGTKVELVTRKSNSLWLTRTFDGLMIYVFEDEVKEDWDEQQKYTENWRFFFRSITR